MEIKDIARRILPYGYISQRYNARNFELERLIQESDDVIDLSISELSKFKTIVSVQGFGYSGSGAVVDLLREYSNCQVIGYVSVEGSKTSKKASMAEVDIIRLSGGLFEIENYIDSTNAFHNNALINRTIKLFASSPLSRIPEIQKLYVSFLKTIIDFSIPNLSKPYYNGYLYNPGDQSSIYFLKQMTKEQFRIICGNFLNHIFNYFHSQGCDYFVADQLYSDGIFDMHRNQSYTHNLKVIFIPRDPRDLYAWTNYKKVEWIPQKLEAFIKWYKIMYRNLHDCKSDALIIQYEGMCLDYENECKKVVKFLGLDERMHTSKCQCFNPDSSKRFVNLWKTSNMPTKDFDQIKSELSEYCTSLID